jgi:hypothetical protein
MDGLGLEVLPFLGVMRINSQFKASRGTREFDVSKTSKAVPNVRENSLGEKPKLGMIRGRLSLQVLNEQGGVNADIIKVDAPVQVRAGDTARLPDFANLFAGLDTRSGHNVDSIHMAV